MAPDTRYDLAMDYPVSALRAMQESRVREIIAADAGAMAQLRAVRALELPDWCISGGFVRNRVWDKLANSVVPYRADTDVLFFDLVDISRQREQRHEAQLAQALPQVEWQVRNQARMHLANGDPPYRDTQHAMRHWLETCTAIGVRLDADDRLQVIAPLGLDDLLNLVFRPTAAGERRREAYRQRIHSKPWRAQWPSATFIE
jgi:hypothetical protein